MTQEQLGINATGLQNQEPINDSVILFHKLQTFMESMVDYLNVVRPGFDIWRTDGAVTIHFNRKSVLSLIPSTGYGYILTDNVSFNSERMAFLSDYEYGVKVISNHVNDWTYGLLKEGVEG